MITYDDFGVAAGLGVEDAPWYRGEVYRPTGRFGDVQGRLDVLSHYRPARDGAQQYTGQDRDTESNLDHFWFRSYNSSQGRWSSPDPAGMAAVDPTTPQSWNRYAYVMNNPLSYVDPLGLFCEVNPGGDVKDNFVVNCKQGAGGLFGWGSGEFDLLGMTFATSDSQWVYDGGWYCFSGCLSGGSFFSNVGPSIGTAISTAANNGVNQPPWKSCQWGTQWLCQKVFKGTWLLNNMNADQQIFNITSNWDTSNTGITFLQINQLEPRDLP